MMHLDTRFMDNDGKLFGVTSYDLNEIQCVQAEIVSRNSALTCYILIE